MNPNLTHVSENMIPAQAGRVIAIASGKGGVGKTWFAITLAHALARRQQRVLLFDADLGLANVDIQLGLLPERDLGAVLFGAVTLEAAITGHEGGFDILAGRSGSGDMAAMNATALPRINQLLNRACARYDTVILDLGAGLDGFVRSMAARAELLLVMATDEPTSLTDAYAVIKLHQRDVAPRQPLSRIVINQATSHTAGRRSYATLAKATEQFLGTVPSLAGIIRHDEKVRDTIRRQSLLMSRHPTSNAGLDVAALASAL